MMKHKYTFAALAAFAFMFASSSWALPHPVAASFARGAQFEVAGYDSSKSALSNFPVLIRIANDSPSGFNYSQLWSSSDGADLCFIDMDGNGLPFEIDTWDPDGTSLIWVTLPTMEQGTQFVMCWGSDTSGKTVCSDNPFSGYKGVWHMNAVSPADASGSGNNGTAGGSPVIDAAGAVGSALSLPTTSDYVTCGEHQSNAELKDAFTVEAWVHPASYSGNRCIFGKNKFISIRTESQTSINVTTPGKKDHPLTVSSLPNVGTWWHLVLTFQKNTSNGCKVYLNGDLAAHVYANDIDDQSNPTEMWFGKNQWGQNYTGLLDEIRLSAGIRSADWIAATYATQYDSDPAFLTAGEAQVYEASAAPDLGLVASSSAVHYTNATLTVNISSLGMDDGMNVDAVWVDPRLVVSTNDDLSVPLFILPLSRVSSVPVSEPVDVMQLVTNTTYYARLLATNSFGVAGESGIAQFVTRNPGVPTGTATFFSRGFRTLVATGAVTDFGIGAESATIRFEASSDNFATIVASAESAAVLDQAASFTIENLTPGIDYALRLRIVNDWGLVTYVPLDGTYPTHAVPIAASGIGYVFSADNSAVDLSFGVTEVFDGATCSATLEYNGATIGTRNFSSAETLSWPGVASASGSAVATVTVTATVEGIDYAQTWTIAVIPGATAVAVSDVADHASAATAVRIHVGDVVALPELSGSASYTVMHDRVVSISGNVLTALEPGIVGVKCIDTAGAETTLAVIVLPESIGNGSIYIFKEASSTKEFWTRASSWEKVGSAENDSWPRNPDDIAVIPFYDTTGNRYIRHESDITVGGILFGSFRDNETMAILERFKDAASSVITFERTDDAPAFVKVTSNTTATRTHTLRLGGYAILVNCVSSVIADSCSDTTSVDLSRGKIAYEQCTIRIPEGRYWSIDGLPGYGLGYGQSTASPPHLTGSGVFWKKGMGGMIFSTENNFYGTVIDSSHGNLGGFDRSAPLFWHGPGGTNVSVAVVGCVASNGGTPSISSSGYGWFRTGWDPAHGVEAPHPDVPWNPRKTMTLHGGAYNASSTENSNWGVGTRCERIYEKLVINAGMSYIGEGDRDTTKGHPINYIEWDALEHQDKGSLVIYDPSRRFVAATTSYTNAMTVVRNHDSFLVGQGADGDCLESDVYPIIPWIVAPTHTDDSNWRMTMFASFDADGRLARPVWNNTELDAAASPFSNAYLWDKTIQIGTDVTLNSLFMNNSGRNKYLGEGRTLTLTSGGLVLQGSNTAIGLPGRTDNGALVLGDATHPGYIFAKSGNASSPNQIWADVTSPGGFVAAYTGYLTLGGNQTGIGDEIAVNAGILTLGDADHACSLAAELPIRIYANATLKLPNDSSTTGNILKFDGAAGWFGKVEVPEGVAAKCKKAYWRDYPETAEWQVLKRGIYGSSESGAPNVRDDLFVGAGTLQILRDDSTMPFFIIVR